MFNLRPAKEEDLPFVFQTWLRSFRQEMPKRCPSEIFYREHQKLLNRILEGSKTIVACSPNDSDQIFGYVTFEETSPATVHFTYVKKLFSKLGIGTALLLDASKGSKTIHYTHHTPAVNHLKFELIHNPYLLRRFYV